MPSTAAGIADAATLVERLATTEQSSPLHMEGRLGRGGDPTPQTEALRRLEDAVASIHDSESFRRWLAVAARFHNYSLGNQLLIAIRLADLLGQFIRGGESPEAD